MLRPATPLSVVLFAAFALMLLAVLSTPIIEAIPLSDHDGVSYGVFGFCKGGQCSGIQIGYDVSGLHDDRNAFDLPESVRNTLSAILIVHPVAALLVLVLLIMAVVAHLHSPSHSSRYLLVIFVFSCITFLVCLLAFLIDVLVFIPHLGWGTYVVLAGTILVGLSGLVSCAMRRTLVSRKSRKKQIAENAEMSGENYYNRENQLKSTGVATQPTMPVLSGGNGGTDNLPQFASLDDSKKDDRVSDERIPLTQRSPVNRSPSNNMGNAGDMNAYNRMPPSRAGSVPRPERDQYGNPVNVGQDPYGMRRMPSNETNRSMGSMNSRGRGGMPPPGYRGRGGYGRGGYGGPSFRGRGGYGPGPRGRGGYGPPPGGRGGYGPPGRGGGPYGGGMAAAGAAGAAGVMMANSTAPPSYRSDQASFDDRGGAMDQYGAVAGPYDRRPSEGTSDYQTANNSTNPSLPSVAQGGYEPYHPPQQRESLARAESPPPLPCEQPQAQHGPVGQAIEMDATSGSPAHPPQGFGNFNNGIRDSDMDIAGMVGLQQGLSNSTQARHDTYMSEGSKYSTDEQYIPPRQAWGGQQNGRNSPHAPSPLNQNRSNDFAGRNSPAQNPSPANNGGYYEDIDPRFATSTPDGMRPPPLQTNMPPAEVYDDQREQRSARARSPGAESDRSNFTSISQRSVNPRWNPPPPMPGYGGQPMPRRPPPRQQDVLLNNNPDFEMPGQRVGSPPRGPGGGMIPGSAYPQGPL